MQRKDLSLVIPVYNEVDNLRPLLAEIHAALDDQGLDYEIIFIDDGSGMGVLNCCKRCTRKTAVLSSSASGATTARPPPSPPASTTPKGASFAPWTPTAKTTPPTFPGCSTKSMKGTTSSTAGA
jgi:cellulose synthase/poly-beta-1,6-N-acetylglucosamine synthase-like glycosyltransferase